MSARKKRNDKLALLGALALLLAVLAGWWLTTSRTQEARADALAGVPEFPKPGQVSVRREPSQKEAKRPPSPAPPQPKAERKADRMNNFVLAPASTVSLIQVNALFNTPLYDRFRECAPPELKIAEQRAQKRGIDLEHDIDRIAIVPGGFAVSGFFEGKGVVEMLTHLGPDEPAQKSYRGQTIWSLPNGSCAVQLDNLLLMGAGEQACEPLIDRALDPPAESSDSAAEELYGDLYFRSDLSDTDAAGASAGGGPLDSLTSSLSGMTLRANVWDDVAVSFEGTPKDAKQLGGLSEMARGALSLAQDQVDEGDDKLQALSDLAKVDSADGKLKIDLALPADQLFKRLHIPCPGQSDAGAGNGDR